MLLIFDSNLRTYWAVFIYQLLNFIQPSCLGKMLRLITGKLRFLLFADIH
jgi:hypothetical protein